MRRVLVAALVLTVWAVSPAAETQAANTRDQTIRIGSGTGFQQLSAAKGSRPYVRRAPGAKRSGSRATRRRSLAYFAHLSDLHLTDEESPARKEYLASEGDASYRPQDALSVHAADALIRAVEAQRRSPRRTGTGRRASRMLTLLTGDVTDNAQANELAWFTSLVRGQAVNPDSGVAGPCPAADSLAEGRRYTGIQRRGDFPSGVSAPRRAQFWDPDLGGGGGHLDSVTFPGLMERAQLPLQTKGLSGRWLLSPGNHDVLRQGLAPGPHPAFGDARATACSKTFPSDRFSAATLGAFSDREALDRFEDPDVLGALARDSRPVQPDPARRMYSIAEMRRAARAAGRPGWGRVSAVQRRRSKGKASYYGYTPRRGMRFISLDTNAESGGSGGNLDDPQYRWLEAELDRNSSVRLDGRGRVHRDRDPNRLIVVFGHHRLEDMYLREPDELAPCPHAGAAGCDGDPRRSTPLHTGLKGRQPVATLLRRYPNVVAFVGGHVHRNFIGRHFRRDGKGGFWEVSTAGGNDFPGQARMLELMDNRDGSLSLYTDLIDSDAPAPAPAPGTPATSMTDSQLGSLARALAANGRVPRFSTKSSGDRDDGNTELLLRDPRRLVRGQ